MGICKCKNTTDLYCFTHDCHVCERCITDENGGHQACYVRKYVDYINDSAFTPPVCGRCHKLDDAGEGHPPLVRLPCLDVVHLECLDAIGVDATSAQSSVKCPLCGADVFPKGATRESPIMDALCEKLKDSPWAAGLVEGVQKSVMSEVPPAKSSVPKAIEVPIPPVSNNPTLLSSAATATPLTSTPSDDIQIQLNVSREDENNPTYTLDQLNGISKSISYHIIPYFHYMIIIFNIKYLFK